MTSQMIVNQVPIMRHPMRHLDAQQPGRMIERQQRERRDRDQLNRELLEDHDQDQRTIWSYKRVG